MTPSNHTPLRDKLQVLFSSPPADPVQDNRDREEEEKELKHPFRRLLAIELAILGLALMTTWWWITN